MNIESLIGDNSLIRITKADAASYLNENLAILRGMISAKLLFGKLIGECIWCGIFLVVGIVLWLYGVNVSTFCNIIAVFMCVGILGMCSIMSIDGAKSPALMISGCIVNVILVVSVYHLFNIDNPVSSTPVSDLRTVICSLSIPLFICVFAYMICDAYTESYNANKVIVQKISSIIPISFGNESRFIYDGAIPFIPTNIHNIIVANITNNPTMWKSYDIFRLKNDLHRKRVVYLLDTNEDCYLVGTFIAPLAHVEEPTPIHEPKSIRKPSKSDLVKIMKFLQTKNKTLNG